MIMGWRYAAKEFKYGGETYYGIVEVYPDLPSDTDTPVHTVNEVTISGDTVEDLTKWLRIALEDLEKYPVITEE
jgi:hypothetical protein